MLLVSSPFIVFLKLLCWIYGFGGLFRMLEVILKELAWCSTRFFQVVVWSSSWGVSAWRELGPTFIGGITDFLIWSLLNGLLFLKSSSLSISSSDCGSKDISTSPWAVSRFFMYLRPNLLRVWYFYSSPMTSICSSNSLMSYWYLTCISS